MGVYLKTNTKKKIHNPDYKGGCCTPDGVQWELAGWVSTTQSGDKYLSIKVQTPYVKEEEASEPVAKAVSNDLPF